MTQGAEIQSVGLSKWQFVGCAEWGFSLWVHNAKYAGDFSTTKSGKYKFADGHHEAITIKIKLKKADYSSAEIAAINAKYKKANELLYKGTEVATVRSKPLAYNKYHSKRYLHDTDPVIRQRVKDPTHSDHIAGGINGIKLRQEIPGNNVDEIVGRIWGGRPVKGNQQILSESVNNHLGPTEQGIRDRLIKVHGMGDARIRKFKVYWE